MNKLLSAMIALVFLSIISLVIGWNGDSARAAPGGMPGPPIDSDDIGGKVHVQHGSAAGVWVIAETDDLDTGYRKIVVTDDSGNFVIPDLPDATYHVWVRGYGLVDSTPVNASPGQKLQLQADLAETDQEAAEIYPGNYWYSLLELPSSLEVSTVGYPNQASWESQIKLGCELCHQVGDEHTRDLTTPLQWDGAWMLAGTMNGTANGLGRDLAKMVFSDWGAGIEDGNVPPEPPRPQGMERNVVITEWDWGDGFTYAHDEISTDKRAPSTPMYQNGKVWGVDLGEDRILEVDPMANTAATYNVPTRGGFSTPWCLQPGFCTWNLYINPANPHNPMLDDNGRLWITTQIRSEAAADRPDFCLEKDSTFIFAGHRQVGYFDTNTEEFSLINTCFGTHHLQFDNDGILWLSGDSAYIGWVDPAVIDSAASPCGVESCPSEVDAQDWSRVNIDETGTGDCDTGIFGFHYGIIPNATDGSVWTGVLAAFPGNIQRFDPSTGCHEVYEPPAPGFGPRGIDVDTDGNVWTCLGGSSHVAKFDRSLCVATGQTADGHVWGDGTQCQGPGEGWQLWEIPGPNFQECEGYGGDQGGCKSDFHYYAWVDQFNTFGLGENVVFCNGTGSDSLIAFNPETEEFTRIRVPYPLNFYQRGLDGRIDDASAGWKGRGLWVDNGGDPIEHAETEMGQICHVQLRPDPLAH
jgi:hypothetical protein